MGLGGVYGVGFLIFLLNIVERGFGLKEMKDLSLGMWEDLGGLFWRDGFGGGWGVFCKRKYIIGWGFEGDFFNLSNCLIGIRDLEVVLVFRGSLFCV